MLIDQLLKFDAVIFDFDGTLVDTLPLHYEAYRRVMASVGVDLSESDFYDNIGGNARETIPLFLRGRATPISNDELHQRKKVAFSELIATEPIEVLPAGHLAEQLAGKAKMAVASTGSRPGIEKIIDQLGWNELFGAVICGEDAARGKPAPDLYLLAAERLGVQPKGCVMLDDTEVGIEAGRAAGMALVNVKAPDFLEGVPSR